MLIMPNNWGQVEGGTQIDTICSYFLSMMDNYSNEGASSVAEP